MAGGWEGCDPRPATFRAPSSSDRVFGRSPGPTRPVHCRNPPHADPRELPRRPLAARQRPARHPHQPHERRSPGRVQHRGPRLPGRPRPRPRRWRAGPAGARIRAPRGAPQGPLGRAARAPRGADRARDRQRRQHARGRQVRHRRRDRDPRRLRALRQGPRRPSVPRRRGRDPARPHGALLGPARARAAARRRAARQRLQLPGLGHDGESGLRVAGRRPGGREARDLDRPPGVAHGAHHGRERHPARGGVPVRRRPAGRPARAAGSPGLRGLHRVGGHRAGDPVAAEPLARGRARQRRGGLPERGGPGARRGRLLGDLRPVPVQRRPRHDPEERPEVHGRAPHSRPRGARR